MWFSFAGCMKKKKKRVQVYVQEGGTSVVVKRQEPRCKWRRSSGPLRKKTKMLKKEPNNAEEGIKWTRTCLLKESTLSKQPKEEGTNSPRPKTQQWVYLQKEKQGVFNEHISHSNLQMRQGYAVFHCPCPQNLCFPDWRAWHLVWLADPAGVPRNQSQRDSYCHSLLAW